MSDNSQATILSDSVNETAVSKMEKQKNTM